MAAIKKAVAKKSATKKKALKKKAGVKSAAAKGAGAKSAEAKKSQKKKSVIRQRANFRLNEHIVYPAHGVGQIIEISEQEIAEHKHEFFVIRFKQERMVLKVPVSNVRSMGMRKVSENRIVNAALTILRQPPKIKRTMWSRRAQEYEQKITSGDLKLLAEVVRDLHRAEHQPEQSYSERQLYEGALQRFIDEIAVVRKQGDEEAIEQTQAVLNNAARFEQGSP